VYQKPGDLSGQVQHSHSEAAHPRQEINRHIPAEIVANVRDVLPNPRVVHFIEALDMTHAFTVQNQRNHPEDDEDAVQKK
jgi:hypothetical protein